MQISKKHPRYLSLILREKLVRGVKTGITSQAGLIAHGRGEAFDYLLGEKTNGFAKQAITASAALLILSKKPILSINGNSAALSLPEFIRLARLLDCQIEVNLFHFSQKRVSKIETLLKKMDPKRVLIAKRNEKIVIAGINSKRAVVLGNGIGESDCVLVPLEDGDRCEALISLGKKVITIDLNPMSRTARTATITIVDNIVRAMPLLIKVTSQYKNYNHEKLLGILENYNNKLILKNAVSAIRKS